MVSSTTIFYDYAYAGLDDELSSRQYYQHIGDTIGIYQSTGAPDKTGYHVRIRYQERPTVFTSTDTATQFNLDPDWTDYVKFRTLERVAKSGNNADIVMGNNYGMEAEEIKRRLMVNIANKKVKTAREKISFKDWEW